MKLEEKLKATTLRKSGKSYGEILKKVKVSKSTLSLWLREVELTTKQKNTLYIKKRQLNAYRLAKNNQNKRIRETRNIVLQSQKEAPLLIKNSLFLSGLMLYWAEGDKSEKTELVKFTNSDPEMIKIAMQWFRKVCQVPENKFRIALHIHNLFCRKDIENYWSDITKVPLSQFHKTQVKSTSLKHRKNPLYNGTCTIRIGNRNLFRKIKGWKIGFINEINKPDSSL